MAKGASELLDKVKKENKTPVKGPEDPYVKLLINRQRKQLLSMVCFAGFVAFLVILNRTRVEGAPWMVSALPIIGLGIMIGLIPQVEEWEYVPWQTSARQYERHQIER